MASPNGSELIFAQITITDTNAHTYRTDPYSSKSGTGIKIVPALFNREPAPYTIAIVINNGENQTLSAAAIGNIDDVQTISDYTLGTGTINASTADILYVYTGGANAFPSEYISLSLQYSTAPSSGSVTAYVKFYE